MLGGVRVVLQLLAQARDADPQDLFIGLVLRAPDAGEQFLGGEDLAEVVRELQEQAVFGGGQRDSLFAAPDFGARKVNPQVVVDEETRLVAFDGEERGRPSS